MILFSNYESGQAYNVNEVSDRSAGGTPGKGRLPCLTLELDTGPPGTCGRIATGSSGKRSGGLIYSSPTGANVNDVAVALVRA